MQDDKVVSIELIPFDGEVFNLSVEEDSTYVLGNIVTHNCLCFKTAIMPPEDEFTGRLHDWVGGGSDPMMDDYASFVGAGSGAQRGSLFEVSLLNDFIGQALIVWLNGDAKQIVERMQ